MTNTANAPAIPHTRSAVTIRYDALEDRLLVYCGDMAGYFGLLHLTRRITGSLLQGIMRLLSSGGPQLLRVPAGLQQDVLHFEHQSALAQAVICQPPQASIPDRPPQITILVTTVNVSQTPGGSYISSWVGAQRQVINMTMSRLDLHCLTHVLQQHAQAAGWDLPALPRWMQSRDGQPGQSVILS